MNNAEKTELILIFGECHRNTRLAVRTYAERYPDRYHPPHNYILRLLQGLNQNGEFPGRQNHQQRPRPNMFNENIELQVLAYIRANPRSSIRHVAREINISYGSVQKILKKHKMHPFKMNLVQHLRATDFTRRLEFIAWFSAVQFHDDPSIVSHILWTDESKFTNNGIMNKQNNRYWDNTNPHWSRETNFQTVWEINVWCGLVGGKLLGPYFYDGILNGRRYLNFLTNELPILLDDVPLDAREHMFFQQDGAPAHNAIIVEQYLNQIFPNRWIGTNGLVPWPARSPDLTPLDFFLWGYLKTVVYADPPINLQDLKNKIQVACDHLTDDQIKAATSTEFLRRLELCLEHHGENFEQFIK
jgi:hypothetical protein